AFVGGGGRGRRGDVAQLGRGRGGLFRQRLDLGGLQQHREGHHSSWAPGSTSLVSSWYSASGIARGRNVDASSAAQRTSASSSSSPSRRIDCANTMLA